jgi:hypothetical protein
MGTGGGGKVSLRDKSIKKFEIVNTINNNKAINNTMV